MLLLYAVIAGLVWAYIWGGRLERLAELSWRGAHWVMVAFFIQIVIFSPLERFLPTALIPALHVCSYLLLAAVLLANRRMPGVWLVFAGLVGNLAAIAGAGGYMPASETALRGAGLEFSGIHYNSVVGQNTWFWFLGDMFYIPRPWPGANVFSVGDALIAVGAIRLLWRGTGAGWRCASACPGPSSTTRK
jgi:hypothetical protein